MKNLCIFRLRDATVALALIVSPLLASAPAMAQDGPGNKPEIMAPMHEAKPKVASTSFTVRLGDKSITISPAEFATLPHETVAVTNGHTKAAETYTGVTIATLLDKLGLPFTKTNEHTLLKTILVAEGTDGYKVILSTYETLATIRGKKAIVADTLDGTHLDKDGAFKLVIPGDSRPQRWVQNLKSLTFKTVE
ncbi:hypothetical protein HDF16_000028 [Granulicella aggregans]|uniref:Molybdopterin-dependent oxidoreductase-like protein n=1 Tax=Granulicella aggregans TaxID=474949 RepID=A0A7W7Z8N1_9BACT|nr:hypothetical protein [Granulicella aggregans]MBB5055359.1 hypothetical protein [Granulicella aggregans]